MEFRPILSSLLRNKTGALLIAMQIALTLAIVSNALHIVSGRLAMAARSSGVDDESRVFRIGMASFKDLPDFATVQKRDEQLIRAVPGVTSVAWTNQTPLSRSGWNMSLTTDRKQTDSVADSAYYMTPGPLLATLGLKLLEGHDFTDADIMDIDPKTSPEFGRAAIVSKALAEKLYPGAASVIGKPVLIGSGDTGKELRIIGVVERLQTPWSQASEKGEYSLIAGVRFADGYQYAVRTEPGQLERVMREVEAALIKSERGRLSVDIGSVQSDRTSRYRDDKAVAWLLITVTILLLLVTASGIVGMAALWVSQRRKQIGVRRALGARRVDILRYFIAENLLITSGGIVAGLLLAMALNQLLVSQLELARLPLGYLAAGSGLLWLLGVLAVYGPAWRASSISPAIATRSA